MSVADAVVLVHFAFIVFVVVGGLLVLRFPKMAWLHLPAAIWGASVQFGDWVCPLTYLEIALRGEAVGSSSSSSSSFVERVVMPVVYPDLLQEGILTPAVRIGLGVAVVVLNVAVYAIVVVRRRHRLRRTE